MGKSLIGLSARRTDFDNATSIGYRFPNGAFATIRIYDNDPPDVVVKKLHQFAKLIEQVMRGVPEAPAVPQLEPGASPGPRSTAPAWPFPVGTLCSCGYPQQPCSRKQTDCVVPR